MTLFFEFKPAALTHPYRKERCSTGNDATSDEPSDLQELLWGRLTREQVRD
jgi:hypothetical protein